MSSNDDIPTVTGGRRRPSGPEDSAPRERADTPERERPQPPPPSYNSGARPPGSGGAGGIPPSYGGGIPPSQGGGSSGGRLPLPLLLLGGLLVVGAILLMTFMGGGGDPADELAQVQPQSQQAPGQTEDTSLPAQPGQTGQTTSGQGSTANVPAGLVQPAAPPPPVQPGSAGDKWLVMLYQDADDRILEQDIHIDLNEAELAGSGGNLTVVAQLDRYAGGFNGDRDWTETRRFLVTPDGNLQRLNSQAAAIGEANMADAETLVDFVTWAMKNYPADRYALILSDHGMGWPGGWSDATARGARGVPIAEAMGDQLYLVEMDAALQKIRDQTGLEKFDLIGLDACLMADLEVFTALAPHARYAVASQETEPALGWAYTSFLDALKRRPAQSGSQLGEQIVKSYINEDQRVVDDQARAEFTRSGSSAARVTQQLSQAITLSAVDLGQLPALHSALNDFAFAMQGIDQGVVAKARQNAQSYTSIWGPNVSPSYLDLAHFVTLVARNARNPQITEAAEKVLDAQAKALIAEKHGPDKPGSNGISIYFPNSQLYDSPVAGLQSYVPVAERFARDSVWDNFLSFHYTGREFSRQDGVVAEPGAPASVAPGAGAISLSPIELSQKAVAPGETTRVSSVITGENVGYVKLFAGFLDPQAKSIYVADTDYITSSDTRELTGVYYPVWPEGGKFRLQFDWEPIVFGVSDGTTTAEALLEPESYGETAEEAVYRVEGIYSYLDGEQRQARLYFKNAVLQSVFGITAAGESSEAGGAPREIVPQPGDKFTILQKWIDLDDQGRVTQTAYQRGKTLTFGDRPLVYKTLDAAAGNYQVGFIVEDMDGQATAAYAEVTVE